MKKLISALLALCLSVMLVPAVAEDDVTGTWYLTRVNHEGADRIVISDEIIMTITIREDGTANIYTKLPFGEPDEEEYSWTFADGLITLTETGTGNATEAKYADGEVTLEEKGALMILTRKPYTPYEMSPAVKAESAEVFFGTWYPDVGFQYGMMSFADGIPVEKRKKMTISAEGIFEADPDGKVIRYEDCAVDPETGILTASRQEEGDTETAEMTLLEDGTLLKVVFAYGIEQNRIIYVRLAAAEDAA